MSTPLRIEADGRLYALVLRPPPPGTVAFFTPPECPLQVGVLDRAAGHVVPAHSHPLARPLQVTAITEFLHVASGRIEIEVYDEGWRTLGRCELGAGDSVLFCAGGHRVTMHEAARLIEVKQGPWPGEAAAKCFAPAAATA